MLLTFWVWIICWYVKEILVTSQKVRRVIKRTECKFSLSIMGHMVPVLFEHFSPVQYAHSWHTQSLFKQCYSLNVNDKLKKGLGDLDYFYDFSLACYMIFSKSHHFLLFSYPHLSVHFIQRKMFLWRESSLLIFLNAYLNILLITLIVIVLRNNIYDHWYYAMNKLNKSRTILGLFF